MFLRMLRHELREKKGLNLILFLFITAASALVFISAVQVYSSVTGVKRSDAGCKIPDCAFIRIVGEADTDRTEILKKLEQEDEILSYQFDERVQLTDEMVDFANFDESESKTFQGRTFSLAKQPREVNLVYGLKDEPFYIRNGTAAISREVQLQTGAELGDELRIATPIGNIYSFEIAQIFKAPRVIKESYILISDADYEALRPEFPVRQEMCELRMQNQDPIALRDVFMRFYCDLNEPGGFQSVIYYIFDYSEQIFSGLVAGFMVFASVFMILLIFMTIRFTIIASLKEDEKSIGTMRALGVDSLRFRWLFAAKFIAFAVVGGILGIAAGFPFSKLVILKFSPNLLNPPDFMLLLIGAAAVAAIAAVMILFTMKVMGRINRISVIDAIHGENRGERFRKSSVLLLRRCKRIPVPFFLAASDILTRLKRYIFLILSYSLGAAIILLIVNLRCSVVNERFLRYALTGNVDFVLNLSDAQQKIYEERELYDRIPFMDQINAELKEAGIPASGKSYIELTAAVHFGDIDIGRFRCYCHFEETDLLMLRDGTIPELANECAISCYTADAFGIGVGSVIDVGMLTMEYEDGSLSETESCEQFVVTGLFDYMEQGDPVVVMSTQYQPKEEGQGYSCWSSMTIDSDDKDAVMQQLRDYYGADHVMTTSEYVSDFLWKYELILTTMMYVISGAVLVITVLITVLYLNIFLAEDMPEIALLKALGFSDSAVYASQMLRMLLLTVFSVAAGVLLTKTLGLQLLRVVFRLHVGLTGFVFEPMPLFTCVLLPLMFAAVVLIPSVIRLLHVRSVDIRELNEE